MIVMVMWVYVLLSYLFIVFSPNVYLVSYFYLYLYMHAYIVFPQIRGEPSFYKLCFSYRFPP